MPPNTHQANHDARKAQAEFASLLFMRSAQLLRDISDTRDEALLENPLFIEFFRDLERLKQNFA